MPTWIPVLFTALLIVSALSMVFNRRGTRLGGGYSEAQGYVEGTMTIVSAAAGAIDRNGERTCTVTGMVVGPGAAAVEVYGRVRLPSGARVPQSGDDRSVIYKPGKEDATWRFGTLADSAG